jgi:hypothetical protein
MIRVKRQKLQYEVYEVMVNYFGEVNDAELLGTFRCKDDAVKFMLERNSWNKKNNLHDLYRVILHDTKTETIEERLVKFEVKCRLDKITERK